MKPLSSVAARAAIPLPEGEAMVARVRAGESQAFEQLFDAYYGALCGYVAGVVGSPAVAEELVQDLWAQLWAQRQTWQVTSDVRTYPFGAARNRAYNHLRNQRVIERWEARAADEPQVPGMGQSAPPTDDRVGSLELRRAIEAGVRQLTPREREAFLLRWRSGLSHGEIARVMGVTPKTVENTLARAFKTLRPGLARFF